MKSFLKLLLITLPFLGQAQDSLKTKELSEVVIEGKRLSDIERLPAISGTRLWSGKKTEVIQVQNLNANLAEKTPRQIFAKVPGVFVYDMDGTGNQINISTRGLDPHRGWEFNIRRNGAITNTDMYGYPASHYSMPMEAIERIELVRGTGALQYGAQFGGMLNYVSKQPDTTRAIGFESVNSIGSFGLLSTYNAISGKVGKFQYRAYYSYRVSKGYRDNSETNYDAQSVLVRYLPVRNLSLTAELSRSNYLYHLPGQLTDSMFYENPRQSTRARNYYSPEIWIPSITLDWKVGMNTRISWTTSAVLGVRSSVMFDRPANIPDDIIPATLTYAPRQVDIDHYNSYTSELRILHTYHFLNRASTLAGGVQYIHNNLHRQQMGVGTTGSDYDLTLTVPGFGRDMHLKTQNVAFFAENKIEVTPRLSVSPGLRIESGASHMTGTIRNYDPNEIPNTIEHHYPLLGINSEYDLRRGRSLYAGWSQAYRPVIFKDIVPGSVYEKVDKNLKDAFGYNLEAGFRGTLPHVRWDVSVFQLVYNNRLGSQAMYDEAGTFYLYRTNIGNSITRGAELFAEYYASLADKAGLSFFSSTSFFDGRYKHASIRSGSGDVVIDGNKLESVPDVITRNGLTLRTSNVSASLLYSYTGQSFADAFNTVTPSANGAIGLVPAYGILDFNSTLKIGSQVLVRFNISNLTNKQYFTKRPAFYPGPGVWSSDGRAYNLTIGFSL